MVCHRLNVNRSIGLYDSDLQYVASTDLLETPVIRLDGPTVIPDLKGLFKHGKLISPRIHGYLLTKPPNSRSSRTRMGASDSKLVFKKGIFRLSEERNIPSDDPYWTSV